MSQAPYAGFGPFDFYERVLGDLVYAGELAGSNQPPRNSQALEVAQAAERLWEGMLESSRPLMMIAGDAGEHWPHVAELVRVLIDRSAGRRLLWEGSSVPEWIGVLIETWDPTLDRSITKLAGELGDHSERLVVCLQAVAPSDRAMLFCKRMLQVDVGLIVCFYEGECDVSTLARFHRRLERREPLRGRGVLLVPRRGPIFSPPVA